MNDYLSDDFILLQKTLENAGVEIRNVKCDANGGLVRINDKWKLIIPAFITEKARMELYIDSIKNMPMPLLHVPPRVRQLLGEEDFDE
jgi:hypothetical protein